MQNTFFWVRFAKILSRSHKSRNWCNGVSLSTASSSGTRSARGVVKEQNIYRWAGSVVGELCGLPLDASSRVPEPALRVLPHLGEELLRVS